MATIGTLTLDLNGNASGVDNSTPFAANSTVTLFSSTSFTFYGGTGTPANELQSLTFNLSQGGTLIIPTGMGFPPTNHLFSLSNSGNNWTITYSPHIFYSGKAWTHLLDSLQFTSSNSFSLANPDVITVTGGTDFNNHSIKLGNSSQLGTESVICFYAGTLIRTPDGEAAVETLKVGDLVLTAAGEARRVNWLGRQTVSLRFADKLRVLPIRIRAGALGDNVPARDLLVSPDHAMLVDGVLIHASALVNGTSIARETQVPTVFAYFHVELDDHSLILAEGAAAESFVDNIDRMNFDNWSEFEALYPEGKSVEELPYPRAKSQRQVPVNIRVRLAERALAIAADAAQVA